MCDFHSLFTCAHRLTGYHTDISIVIPSRGRSRTTSFFQHSKNCKKSFPSSRKERRRSSLSLFLSLSYSFSRYIFDILECKQSDRWEQPFRIHSQHRETSKSFLFVRPFPFLSLSLGHSLSVSLSLSLSVSLSLLPPLFPSSHSLLPQLPTRQSLHAHGAAVGV
jgi:hypothetical protein